MLCSSEPVSCGVGAVTTDRSSRQSTGCRRHNDVGTPAESTFHRVLERYDVEVAAALVEVRDHLSRQLPMAEVR